jgi:hypothetical protein
MGLLDTVLGSSFDDPRTAATLQLAQGLLSSPRMMQGLAGGLSGYQQAMAQAKQAKAVEEMRAMQLQQMQMQMAAQRQQQEQAQLDRTLTRKAFTPVAGIEANEASGLTEPTLQAASVIGKQPKFDPMAFVASGGSPELAFTLQKSLTPERAKPVALGRDQRLVDPETGQIRVDAIDKTPNLPASIQEYQFAKAQGYAGTFEQFQLAQNRSKAQTLNVNTGERIPTPLVKEQDAMVDRVFNAQSIDADLSTIEGQIKAGKLRFGPVENLVSQAKNLLGVSDEQSRNFASFKTTLEKLRNDSLRLNTGVQTDGDAQREWNALFQNINDTAYVQGRLAEIRKINQRGAKLQRERLNILRRNSGAGELALPEVEPAIGAGALNPSEQSELEALRARFKGR